MRASIEGLYAAFARYPLRARIEGCPHCDLGGAERGLHAKPLRELDEDDLGRFPFKAMSTFGDVDDFRHFFPRIAELITYYGHSRACDLGVLARKLPYGEWERWPEPERAAILRWLGALEGAYLEGGCGVGVLFHDLLEAGATLRGTVEPLLARLPDARSERALDDLAHCVLEVSTAANRGGVPSGPHGAAIAARVVADRDRIEHTLREAMAPRRDRAPLDYALEALAFPPFA